MPVWSWEIARDPNEVHNLLGESDAYAAGESGTPAPVRNHKSTEAHVRTGAVHLLREDGRPAGTFTLSPRPAGGHDVSVYPPARRPLYLQRLAVGAAWRERFSLVGVQCLRRAIEIATQAGTDVLRAEANPDLDRVRTLLDLLGFAQWGDIVMEAGVRRVNLQKII